MFHLAFCLLAKKSSWGWKQKVLHFIRTAAARVFCHFVVKDSYSTVWLRHHLFYGFCCFTLMWKLHIQSCLYATISHIVFFFQIVSAQTSHLQLDWKDCRTSACSAHTPVLHIITYVLVLSLAVVKINNSADLLKAEYLLIKYSHFHQTLECHQAELSLEARGDAALRSWVVIQVKTNTATPLD